MQTKLLLNNLRAIAKGLNDWADEIEKNGEGALTMYDGGRPRRCKLSEDLYSYENLVCAMRKSI